jgi:hypothetical protein
MRNARKTTAALGALGVCAAMVLSVTSAYADDQPKPGDVVGVGSDTVQYASDFLADGTPAGAAGYNASAINRDVSFFATGDGNGRALYDSTGQLLIGGNAGGSSSNLQGTTTVVLREGTKPVARPDGSGDGIGALIADSPGGVGYEGLPLDSIQYARASRLPKPAEQTSCGNVTGCGALHVYQFASDNLEIAKWSGASNAVPLSAATLLKIYTCDSSARTWNQVGGTSTDAIIPVIPQAGSGTRNFFEADIGETDAQMTTASATGTGCVKISEEHDPTGITHAVASGSTTPGSGEADAIEPFSVGRALLAASGYFGNTPEPASDFAISLITGCTAPAPWTSQGFTSDQGFCGTSGGPANIPVNGGTPINTTFDSAPIYDSARGLYFVVREDDINSTVPMQSGGTKNFVATLFGNTSTSQIKKSSSAALIKAAFLVPAYADLLDAHS